MNYPTVKQQHLYRSILKNAADLADTVNHADKSSWVIDTGELLEYVMAQVDRINDVAMILIADAVKEDVE